MVAPWASSTSRRGRYSAPLSLRQGGMTASSSPVTVCPSTTIVPFSMGSSTDSGASVAAMGTGVSVGIGDGEGVGAGVSVGVGEGSGVSVGAGVA